MTLSLPPYAGFTNTVHCADALDFMYWLWRQGVQVDAIITDLPYGTTACSWDEIIPFEPMWAAVKRILKPRGVFVTTASQPFTSKLVMSNLAWFYEELVWDKVLGSGFLDANRKHLKVHETVQVFCEGMPVYNPQMSAGKSYRKSQGKSPSPIYHHFARAFVRNDSGDRYPKSIIQFSNADQTDKQHNTQKPVALYEYLIRTYTQPGELVLDFCCGSGTTGVACVKTGRNYIMCDTTPEYVKIAQDRPNAGFVTLDVAEGIQQPSLFASVAV